MRLSCAFLLATVICFGAENAPKVFRIAGAVVDALGEKPLKRVRVVLSPVERPSSEVSSWTTGEDGKFVFEVLKGSYILVAQRQGLPAQYYGAPSLEAFIGVAIITGPDQITDRLIFRVHPPSAISGRITDEAGDPVEDALVQLVRVIVLAGKKTAAPRAWAYTNDLGEYRFGNLGAGTYYLAVTGKPWYTRDFAPATSEQPAGPALSYAPVFYPNTSDARAAGPLVLRPGQEVPANFSLTTTPGVDITVHYNSDAKSRPQQLSMQLVAEGVVGSELFSRVVTGYGSLTRIPAVTPGRYTIRVTDEKGMRFLASKPVEAASANLNVQIDAKVPPAVAGTVETEGGSGALSSLIVMLHNEAANSGVASAVTADGHFTFPGVPPGHYRVHVTGKKGVFAKSLVVAGAPLEDTVVDVGPEGVSGVKVVTESGAGRIKGFVYRGGRPVAGVMVILAPDPSIPDHIHYQGYMTDSDGSFDFSAARPGDYRLFATDDLDFEYSDPAVVKPFLSRGKLVRVEKGGTAEESIEMP